MLKSNQESGNKEWERVSLTSTPQLVISDLEPYGFRTFRVCAVGTKVQSPFSQELLTRAS